MLFFAMLIPLALGAGDPHVHSGCVRPRHGFDYNRDLYMLVKGEGKCSGIVQKFGAAEFGYGEQWLRYLSSSVCITLSSYTAAGFYNSEGIS